MYDYFNPDKNIVNGASYFMYDENFSCSIFTNEEDASLEKTLKELRQIF